MSLPVYVPRSPERTRTASPPMSDPANPASGPRTPASAQEGTVPGGGGASNRQRRQPLVPGTTVRSWAVKRRSPPWTRTFPAASAASFARNFVAKLSEPSTTTSAPETRSGALASSKRRSCASTATDGKRRARRRAAATALRSPRSASPKSTWRARFEVSTASSSTTTSFPTPELARTSSAGAPSPPAPMTSATFPASESLPMHAFPSRAAACHRGGTAPRATAACAASAREGRGEDEGVVARAPVARRPAVRAEGIREVQEVVGHAPAEAGVDAGERAGGADEDLVAQAAAPVRAEARALLVAGAEGRVEPQAQLAREPGQERVRRLDAEAHPAPRRGRE